MAHPFPNCYLGSAAWGDYNKDGKFDVVITGVSDGGGLVAAIWRNEGGGNFTDAGANLPGLDLGEVAWGDYDNDGDLDLMVIGYDAEAQVRHTITCFPSTTIGVKFEALATFFCTKNGLDRSFQEPSPPVPPAKSLK